MDVSRYLQRIRYDGSREPSDATLRALHIAHLRSVPFENLDVALGRRISLDLDALFDKIVIRRRGGFCYELNGLFASLLQHLGFVVTYLSASDAHDDNRFGPEYDHLTLIVQAPGENAVRWLADVGWGDSFVEPLRLDTLEDQEQGPRAYRIAHEGDYRFLWQRDHDGRWERQYRFTLQPRDFAAFAGMCEYHQTSAGSPFVQRRVCTLATYAGRITLSDSRLITTAGGRRYEEPVGDEESYRRILKTRFGIEY